MGDNRTLRITTYVVLGVIFLFLAILAGVTFRQVQTNQQATQKADQLIAALNEKGIHAPTQQQITRTLGTDGGPVCADPGGALRVGFQRVSQSNGAGGPGQRPVFVAQQVLQAELAAIQIYCPDQADDFQNFINSTKFADVIKN